MDESKPLDQKWLEVAFFAKDLVVMEHLIMSGANINSAREPDRWAALHFVVWRCRWDMCNISAVELLLRHKADPYLQTHHGQTPLDVGLVDLHTVDNLAHLLHSKVVSCLRAAME